MAVGLREIASLRQQANPRGIRQDDQRAKPRNALAEGLGAGAGDGGLRLQRFLDLAPDRTTTPGMTDLTCAVAMSLSPFSCR